ncbi:ketopantoate reductase family protein [Subtercola frigoramans]|uniref:2-dehydropantoate 2-reductase n=1 Tax=Subtercola frigoramans TaxID=120298 RepID=A0ABS2L0S1_9MICO|nr:2-dehydropantoate 2-reductase [Subtercola frigoramans]MBM7470685.1 2-dehydropantoate 2-reductase [Subtercola frigoramans]
MPPKRIAFVGTGANGAAIAADLTRAGLDVTFIEQWPAHVEAMRTKGIRVQMPAETVVTPVTAIHLYEVAQQRRHFDIVFVLVKAYDTRWACELIKPLVAPDGLVVGLQNGMSLDDIADIVGPERTIGAVIEVAGNMYEPGVVNRQTPPSGSWFALGAYDESARGREHEIADVLGHAGTVQVYEKVRAAKWGKLIVNAGELVPSAILGMPLADVVEVPRMHEFMLQVCREAADVAVASGIELVPIFGLQNLDLNDSHSYGNSLLNAVLERYSLPDTKTTVLQDWIKGRRSEVHEINGLVVELGRRFGVDTTANTVTVEVARRIEAGELKEQPANAALLTAVLAPSAA